MDDCLETLTNVDLSRKLLSILETASKKIPCNIEPIDRLYSILHALLCWTVDIFKSTGPYMEAIDEWTTPTLKFIHAETMMSTAQWVDFVKIVMKVTDTMPVLFEYGRVCRDLFEALHVRNVPILDRAEIIKMFMDAEMVIFSEDIDYALQVFGYGKELETVLFHRRECIFYNKGGEQPLQSFIFGWEDGIYSEMMSTLYGNLICSENFLSKEHKSAVIIGTLRYFSLPDLLRRTIKTVCQKRMGECSVVLKVLDEIPRRPTLFELSRNCVYNNVLKSLKGRRKSSDLHRNINSLDIPLFLKDVLRFKVPLYY